jgi:hypothetical protein
MTTNDEHIHHTWSLTRQADGDDISIDLWTDGYSVRVDGGPDDGYQDDRGRQAVDQLLAKYRAAGYQLVRDYPVNDLAVPGDDSEELVGADQRPEKCPECGTEDLEHVLNHVADFREGPAWLCTGCRWGQWIVA